MDRMSPLVRKKKMIQSQAVLSSSDPLRGSAPVFVSQEVDQNLHMPRMKRSCRKRYEDLQSISAATSDQPTASCSVLSSAALANGSELGSSAPPTARLPPRLEAKEVWAPGPGAWVPGRAEAPRDHQDLRHQNPRDQDSRGHQDQTNREPREQDPQNQTWLECRDGAQASSDQAWTGAQEEAGPQVPSWEGSRGVGQEQWGPRESQDQGWTTEVLERGNVWRPDLNMKKVERVDDVLRPAGGAVSYSDDGGETSSAQSNQNQNPPSRKDPPSYPPGSQEEAWQLQITSRGRVACPRCRSVSRKTVEGLKKHMENCRLQPFTCQHCGKQLKSSTGMKYHIMADHSHLPSVEDSKDLDNRAIKEKLRKILKRLGKLKCSREGCNAAFGSIMGYVYHMRKCGKEEAELQKLLLNCPTCGKEYRSKAGLEYHRRSEHAPTPLKGEEGEDEGEEGQNGSDSGGRSSSSGRVQRASAQVANLHLAALAQNELPKDWPKRKFPSDLVPDDHKLKYSRPGLPAFSQEVLMKWKSEVKLQRKVICPNQGCGCTYTSVSGLKAHLGLCSRGDFEAGKYRCLICSKEFNSESGVKYHITSVHAQDWFVTNKKAFNKFEKFLRNQSRPLEQNQDQAAVSQYNPLPLSHPSHPSYPQHHHHHCLQLHPLHHHQHQQPLQPLHHLQPQFLSPDGQNLPPEQEQDPPQPPPTPVLYHPQEAPGPVWVEDIPGLEQAPIDIEMAEEEVGEGGSGERGGGRRRNQQWNTRRAEAREEGGRKDGGRVSRNV